MCIMSYNLNGNIVEGNQMPTGSTQEPGVVEVMASPETEEPFTEDMINQVIAMLQAEGQITPETHTVIVHTASGPTLRVQIQQVEGTEIEQDNIGELTGDCPAEAQVVQDQLVYVGQAGEEYTAQELQQQYVTPQTALIAEQHILTNGGEYMAEEQPLHGTVATNADGTVLGTIQYSTASTEDEGIPAALMSNVAEQVLQAANIMDSGYTSAHTTPGGIFTSAGTVYSAPQHALNGGVHTESLQNGVVFSYGTSTLNSQSQANSLVAPNGLVASSNRSGTFCSARRPRGPYAVNSKVNGSTQSSAIPTYDIDSGPEVQALNGTTESGLPKHRPQVKRKPVSASHSFLDNLVRVTLDTGYCLVEDDNLPDNVIRIKTTTGQLKTRAAKFHRCPTCTTHFAAEHALLQHVQQGCNGSRKRTSYECTYCSTKFASKVKTVEHLKVCTMRSQARNRSRGVAQPANRVASRRSAAQTVEVEITSDDEEEAAYRQEKNIVYDDDDDVDVDLAADNEDYESHLTKVSQKHLGPMLTEGKFKCRDCDRTFSKDAQYKRHIGACTNAPLNASRIDDADSVSERRGNFPERRRGRHRKVTADSSAKPRASLPDSLRNQKVAQQVDSKDDVSDLEWDFLASPKADKNDSSKKNNQIMDMLKENLKDNNLIDGPKDLSDSFLQCLDSGLAEDTVPKQPSPCKDSGGVCGLCVRRMKFDENLVEHVTTVHGKDVVNMRAILTNNTDLTTHKCPLCDLHFVSSQGVQEHISAQHMDMLHDCLRTLRANSLDLPCPWCHHRSLSKELFQQHLASDHNHMFPETALLPPVKPMKAEELAMKSLQAAMRNIQESAEDLLIGRVCLICGLAFAKTNRLEQHMITCSSSTAKGEHKCCFQDCTAVSFATLDELVAHIEEEHCGDENCESRLFPNTILFNAWLKQEQQRSGYKFVLATSRVCSGWCHSTYLCHSYNSAGVRGRRVTSGGAERQCKPCYARLHARTRWCHNTYEYCGRTEVKYYKEHQHGVSEDAPEKIDTLLQACTAVKIDFNTREETPSKDVKEEVKENLLGNLSVEKTDDACDEKVEDKASHEVSVVSCNDDPNDADESDKKEGLDATNKKLSPSIRPVSSAVTAAIAASKKVLEKGNLRPSVNNRFTAIRKPSRPAYNNTTGRKRTRHDDFYMDDADDDEDYVPTSKRRAVDNGRQRTYGAARAPRGRPPTKRKAFQNSLSQQPPARKAKTMEESEENSQEEGETTYVLPANISEWCKLFDMVQSQITYGSLKKADVPEAKGLLKHQDNITALPLEEQVRVFHRLCNLANIQVD